MKSPSVTLDQAVEAAMQLPPEQRDMLLEILRIRQIESRRQEIADGARASLDAFRAGQLQPQPVDEFIQELHQALQVR